MELAAAILDGAGLEDPDPSGTKIITLRAALPSARPARGAGWQEVCCCRTDEEPCCPPAKTLCHVDTVVILTHRTAEHVQS